MRLVTLDGEELWRSSEELVAWSVALSRDGRQVLAGSADNNAYLWDLDADERKAAVFRGHQATVTCAIFSSTLRSTSP